jgi:hypothetical protein
MSTMGTVTVERSIDVRCSAEHAFTVFTDRIADWWPLATHSLGAGMDDHDAVSCVLEPRAGGRLYEVLDDGRELAWGRVVAWEPGAFLALDWNPSLEQQPFTRVEVRFTATGPEACRVELTHRGFEAWERPSATRDSYDAGWGLTLGQFQRAAEL